MRTFLLHNRYNENPLHTVGHQPVIAAKSPPKVQGANTHLHSRHEASSWSPLVKDERLDFGSNNSRLPCRLQSRFIR